MTYQIEGGAGHGEAPAAAVGERYTKRTRLRVPKVAIGCQGDIVFQ